LCRTSWSTPSEAFHYQCVPACLFTSLFAIHYSQKAKSCVWYLSSWYILYCLLFTMDDLNLFSWWFLYWKASNRYLFPSSAVSNYATHELIWWGPTYGSPWWLTLPRDDVVNFTVCAFHHFWTTLGMNSPIYSSSHAGRFSVYVLIGSSDAIVWQLRCYCWVPQTSRQCYQWLFLLPRNNREVYHPWTPCFVMRVHQASTASVYCMHQYYGFHPLHGSGRWVALRMCNVIDSDLDLLL